MNLNIQEQKSSDKDLFPTTEFLLHPFIGRENPLGGLFSKFSNSEWSSFESLIKSLRKYHFIYSIFLF